MRLANAEQLAVDVPFKALAAHPRFQLCPVQRPEVRPITVRQHYIQRLHIINRLAPYYGMRSARVVAQRAAHIAPAARARIRREEHPARRDLVIQLVENDARLRAHPPLFLIHLQHIPHVPREVHDNRIRNRLSGKARATAARQYRQVIAMSSLQHRDHIIGALRQHHTHRLDLIDARIRAIQHARHLVEAHLARYAASQLLNELSGVRLHSQCCHYVHTPRVCCCHILFNANNAKMPA